MRESLEQCAGMVSRSVCLFPWRETLTCHAVAALRACSRTSCRIVASVLVGIGGVAEGGQRSCLLSYVWATDDRTRAPQLDRMHANTFHALQGVHGGIGPFGAAAWVRSR